jgi:putative membrane protein
VAVAPAEILLNACEPVHEQGIGIARRHGPIEEVMMKHLKSSLSNLSAVAVALGLAACGGSNQSPSNMPSSTEPPASEPNGSAMNQPANGGSRVEGTFGTGATNSQAAGPAGGSAPVSQYGPANPPEAGGPAPAAGSSPSATGASGETLDVSNLNDTQLAAVIQAIHQGEIQQGQLAETKASSPEVKRFAHNMVSMHRDMQNHHTALLGRLEIRPSDNAVSNQLKSDAQNQMSTLQALRGRDFDRDYIDAQVSGHNKALELIDRIIANVKSADLKADLVAARSKVEAHLRDAERVQQGLQGSGTTDKQPGSRSPGRGGKESGDGNATPSTPQQR